MKDNKKKLDFHDVDGLGFAAEQGKHTLVRDSVALIPGRMGPLLELLHLSSTGRIAHPKQWMELGRALAFIEAIDNSSESWLRSNREDVGFIRATRTGSDGDSKLDEFLIAAKRAAQNISGFPKEVAGALVGALRELECNIHEHSGSPESGLVAFKAQKNLFEFSIGDQGRGVLQSLKEHPSHSALRDEGVALNAALTDGTSRFGPDSGRGHGFRPIFVGLANLKSELRFRSGDHALTINGVHPDIANAVISQKARIQGFYVNILCHFNSRQ